MPVGIDAVLVPGDIGGIMGIFAENESSIDQDVVAQDRLDGVHHIGVGCQPVSPLKEQMRAIEPLERSAAHRLEFAPVPTDKIGPRNP